MENKYGFISDGKVYLKSVLGNPDREIGTVLLTDEKALEYFQNRFKMLFKKIFMNVQNISKVYIITIS